ncbi:glycosyltransferase [Kocuria nitroreducens]|uniref:glycosyltransferase n=1 Tax=Kocuria nitroreducens TaxID=3058914 RepID=UPI0036DB5BB0
MMETYPDAAVLALWSDSTDEILENRLSETWLARTKLRNNKALALPFMLATWRRQMMNEATWTLVSSHLFAHHIKFLDSKPEAQKFVYVHTPARYIWEPSLDPRGSHPMVRATSQILKSIDKKRAAEGSNFAANSHYVKERIHRTWNQEATVIYPPVDVEKIQNVSTWKDVLGPTDETILNDLPDNFVLSASRFVPYKKLEMAIEVAEAGNIPAVIAGNGPDEGRLRHLADQASVPVYFVTKPTDDLLIALYQKCVAYVFAAVEDFGIMPVEAMAAGTPVICGDKGGVIETVKNEHTGIHLHSDDPAELKRALEKADSLDSNAIKIHAQQFDSLIFKENLVKWTGKTPNNSDSGLSATHTHRSKN